MKRRKLPPGIRQRTETSWQIRYYAKDADGKPERVVETVSGTLTDAKERRLQRLSEVQRGLHVRQKAITVREYFDAWFDERASRSSSYTIERYRTIARLQIYPHVGSVNLTKLTGMHLKKLYALLAKCGGAKGGALSSTTVTQAHHIIHAALATALRERAIAVNPADHCDPPRPQQTNVEALDIDGLQTLIRRAETSPTLARFYIPVLLGGVLGLRRGEMLGLKWSDVNFEQGELIVARSLEAIRLPKPAATDVEPVAQKQPRVRLSYKSPKSGKARRIAVPGFVLEGLRHHKVAQAKARLQLGPGYRDNDLIVPAVDGAPWNPESFSPRFIAAAKALGFPGLHFHVLRHTAVSVRLASGEHVKIVQEAMGHHSAAFTLDRYGHVTATMQRESAARLDEVFRRTAG